MKVDICLLNAFRYENTKGKGTGINFFYTDDSLYLNKENAIGYPNETVFYGYEVFKKLDNVLFGKNLKAVIEDIPSDNPLRSAKKKITKLIYNDKVYELC